MPAATAAPTGELAGPTTRSSPRWLPSGQGTWTVRGRELKLTNLDKVLFPARGDGPPVTKRDLIRYIAGSRRSLLPYLADRPVNLHRYPDGVDRPGFWHKAVPRTRPTGSHAGDNPDADPGETMYVVADSRPACAWLANYGVGRAPPLDVD